MLLLLSALSASAQNYGGGGVVAHQGIVPEARQGARPFDVSNPGLLTCIGGVGYGVKDGARMGAAGHICDGVLSNMAFGGLQSGWQSKRGGIYTTLFATAGAGWLGVNNPLRPRFRGTFLFVRPTVGLGIPLGKTAAIEGSLYYMAPLWLTKNLGGRKGAAAPSVGHGGLQASFLFGDFSKRKKKVKKVVERRTRPKPWPYPYVIYAPPPAYAYPPRPPAPPRPPPPPRAAPVQPGDLPLAIPGGAPPPPPPAPPPPPPKPPED